MTTELRPTVIIGTGGTGLRVALRVKRLFLERFGEVPAVVRILVFDTADDRMQETITRRDGTPVELDTKREFFYLPLSLYFAP